MSPGGALCDGYFVQNRRRGVRNGVSGDDRRGCRFVAPALAAMQIADTEKYLREEINKINESLPSEHRINKIVIRETDFVRSPGMKIVREQNAK